jgi:transcription elongation GreA/GreB family factor
VPAPVNPNRGQLDSTQILQRAFDETTDRIRADASVTIDHIDGEVSVEIDAADGDNIALSNADGSKKVTVTTVGAKNALDVNVTNPEITVSTPLVSNISMPTAGTEYTFTIPAGTKRFSIKLRGVAQLNVTYTSGASGTNYILISAGCEYNEENLDLGSGLPIYFQANKNTQVLEIITWS